MITETLRRCSHCRQVKDVTEFYKHRSEASGWSRACRQCYKDYQDAARSRPITQGDIERFWSQVDKNGPIPEHCPEIGPCWIWLGPRLRNKYGSFTRFSQHILAHRFSYEITYGPLRDGMWSLHKCDNKLCCRPDHLFEGDMFDNMQDASRKGRTGMQLHPERSHFHKTRGLTHVD